MKNKNNLIISIIVPAYNGEKFLDLSLHSLLNTTIEKENLFKYYEVIVVNDGSKDNTYKKALDIASYWNKRAKIDFVKVIDKENGQYGSVINRGIKEARGKYFKVLDVDDTFDVKYFIEIIYVITGIKRSVDVIFTDFSFEKALANKQIKYSWKKYFDTYKILNLEETPLPNNIITMHSIIYRTDFLREIKYEQIEGIYYSDSQYSVVPLSKAQSMFYINMCLYKYYIGRNEQSINLKVMVKNRLHQKMVMDKIVDELLNTNFNSFNQEKYAWRIARNMFEWQTMLIANDKSIANRNKYIVKTLKDLLNKCKKNQKAIKYLKKSLLIRLILFGRGFMLSQMIRFGAKYYARFKLNIMADWS